MAVPNFEGTEGSVEPFIGDRVLAPNGREGIIFSIFHSDLGLPYSVGYTDAEGGTDCFEAAALRLLARATYEAA